MCLEDGCQKCARREYNVDGLLRFVKAMGATRLLMMGGVIFGLLAFFWLILNQANQEDMRMLYTELEPAESSEIAQKLSAQGVPFKIENGGRSILVPSDRVDQLRSTLAGSGMGGHVVGWEIFDQETGLGSTNAEHVMRVKRATQGELQRAIQEIAGISSARVIIVMPERGRLSSRRQEPKASVSISGRGIGSTVATTVQRLVAGAVPGLSTDNVTVINSASGQTLASGDGGEGNTMNSLDDKRSAMERDLKNRIESLIGSSVGSDNVYATVNVELTRDQKTITSNTIDPDSGVEVITHSTENITDEPIAQEGGTVTVANNTADAQQDTPAPTFTSSSETDETINTEYSRTQTQEIFLPGTIVRITAAVMINSATDEVDVDGNSTYTPPSPADIGQFKNLVKSTIGYKASWEELLADGTPGDSVVMMSAVPFSKPEPLAETSGPVEIFPGVRGEDLKGLLKTGITGLVTILVILLIVRPLVKRLIDAIPDALPPEQIAAQQAYEQLPAAGPTAEGGLSAEVLSAAAGGDAAATETLKIARAKGMAMPENIEAQIDVAQVEGRIQDSTLKKVGEIIQKSPEESVAIVRSWLYSD